MNASLFVSQTKSNIWKQDVHFRMPRLSLEIVCDEEDMGKISLLKAGGKKSSASPSTEVAATSSTAQVDEGGRENLQQTTRCPSMLVLTVTDVVIHVKNTVRAMDVTASVAELAIEDKLSYPTSSAPLWLIRSIADPITKEKRLINMVYQSIPRNAPGFKGVDHTVNFKFGLCSLHFRRPLVLSAYLSLQSFLTTFRELLGTVEEEIPASADAKSVSSSVEPQPTTYEDEPLCLFALVEVQVEGISVTAYSDRHWSSTQGAMKSDPEKEAVDSNYDEEADTLSELASMELKKTSLTYILGTDEMMMVAADLEDIVLHNIMESNFNWRRILQVCGSAIIFL
tara:strand:- start:57 stop:1076 length:1020 start_codon:yes stop_codon:yes gene_type:complete